MTVSLLISLFAGTLMIMGVCFLLAADALPRHAHSARPRLTVVGRITVPDDSGTARVARTWRGARGRTPTPVELLHISLCAADIQRDTARLARTDTQHLA